jgi:hypothetical protein
MCPNAYPIHQLYPRLLMRKMINPLNVKVAVDFIQETQEVETIYTSSSMEIFNKQMFENWNAIKKEVKELEKFKKFESISFDHPLISKYFTSTYSKPSLYISTDKKLAEILKVQAKNKAMLEYVDFPYCMESKDLTHKNYIGLVELLKKVMVF